MRRLHRRAARAAAARPAAPGANTGKGKALAINNNAGWKDTVVWSPYGDEGMGFDSFLCVESAAFDAQTLEGGASWVGELSLVPGGL